MPHSKRVPIMGKLSRPSRRGPAGKAEQLAFAAAHATAQLCEYLDKVARDSGADLCKSDEVFLDGLANMAQRLANIGRALQDMKPRRDR